MSEHVSVHWCKACGDLAKESCREAHRSAADFRTDALLASPLSDGGDRMTVLADRAIRQAQSALEDWEGMYPGSEDTGLYIERAEEVALLRSYIPEQPFDVAHPFRSGSDGGEAETVGSTTDRERRIMDNHRAVIRCHLEEASRITGVPCGGLSDVLLALQSVAWESERPASGTAPERAWLTITEAELHIDPINRGMSWHREAVAQRRRAEEAEREAAAEVVAKVMRQQGFNYPEGTGLFSVDDLLEYLTERERIRESEHAAELRAAVTLAGEMAEWIDGNCVNAGCEGGCDHSARFLDRLAAFKEGDDGK